MPILQPDAGLKHYFVKAWQKKNENLYAKTCMLFTLAKICTRECTLASCQIQRMFFFLYIFHFVPQSAYVRTPTEANGARAHG